MFPFLFLLLVLFLLMVCSCFKHWHAVDTHQSCHVFRTPPKKRQCQSGARFCTSFVHNTAPGGDDGGGGGAGGAFCNVCFVTERHPYMLKRGFLATGVGRTQIYIYINLLGMFDSPGIYLPKPCRMVSLATPFRCCLAKQPSKQPHKLRRVATCLRACLHYVLKAAPQPPAGQFTRPLPSGCLVVLKHHFLVRP